MHSDSELRELSEHLLYDVEMLFALTERLGGFEPIEEELPWEVQNGLLESFVIHARGLIEFLWRDASRRQGDGLAAHYFPSDAWAARRPKMETTLKQVPARAGREVAHITFQRIEAAEEARGWHYGQIAASIGRCLRVFVQEVSDQRVSDEFKRRAWNAMPANLRAPVALSWPPDHYPAPVATQAASRYGIER